MLHQLQRGLAALSDLVGRADIASKLGESFGGNRDLYESLGYRTSPTISDFLSYYTRGDIATKVIDLPATASWGQAPEIQTDNEVFVDAIEYIDREHRFFHHLEKVDRLSGIGNFALLLIGTANEDITAPPTESAAADPLRLGYFQVFHQDSVEIEEWDEDTSTAHYGMPLIYKLKVGGTGGRKESKILVPWQRIIHVAEDTLEDRVFGTPRLQKILNRLDDLNKVIGSAGELFWLNVAGVWHADLDPEVSATQEELETFEEELQEAYDGLRRLLQTRGVTLNRVAGEVPDPEGIYAAIRQLISAAAEIPERVLFGSERGELASTQDQKEWQARISKRQNQHCEPVILRETIKRLQFLGVLPAVSTSEEEGYDVMWPPMDKPTTSERADSAQKVADACEKIAGPGAGSMVVPPWEFREEYLGLQPVPPEAPPDFLFDDVGDDIGEGVE